MSRSGDADRRDLVAVEEPMEVRVNGASFAVIMRTPGADRDLAAGFLLAEDVIRSADEIGAIEYCQDTTDEGRDNTINVTVSGGAADRLDHAARRATSGDDDGVVRAVRPPHD